MKYKYLFFLLLITSIVGCKKTTSELPIVFNIHENWEFKSAKDSDWKSATVPVTIFTDLLDHKLIPDPFIETNEEKVQWVSDSTWVYRTTFKLTEDILNKENIELHFEGLDTYAKIY